MFGGRLGWGEILLIGLVLLLLFGPSRLPEMGRSFGKSIREFKDAFRPDQDSPPPE